MIPFGLDLDRFAPRSGGAEVRAALGIPSDRGVVGSVQDAATAVLAGVASSMAARVLELEHQAQASGITDFVRPDIFLTVIATTLAKETADPGSNAERRHERERA